MKFVLISLIIAVAIAFASAEECGPHEYMTDCPPFPECMRSCSYPDPPYCEIPECDDGRECVCIDDYVRNHAGTCVHYTHCEPE